MPVIPINLDEDIIKKVEILIKMGKYKNRTEALRDQITKGIERMSIFEEDEKQNEVVEAIVERLLRIDKPLNLLKTEKSAVDLISEGRER
ncbi:MAG: hypothetical protein ACXAC7_10285 [Candidatus Hodarchaeales archaeon]|jgi:Arc/MetJ-type ribon-helix-helix transcriptional regulator